jgi:hypothetical protein
MAMTEETSIVIERPPDGKMRVTSGSWDGEKVFLRDQVLELRNVEGRIQIARKPRPTGCLGSAGSIGTTRALTDRKTPKRDGCHRGLLADSGKVAG